MENGSQEKVSFSQLVSAVAVFKGICSHLKTKVIYCCLF